MNQETKKIVTRFAPSPTGFVHVGNIRTALYAWLFARKEGGTFILRIEDTDKEREVSGAMEHVMESLEWLGLTWDQGPKVGGPHEPYVQSQRLDIYRKYAEQLIEKGYAYPDPFTEADLDMFRKQAEENKELFLYRNHRPDTGLPWDGTKPLRFKCANIRTTEWHDLARGDLSAGPEALDDFILIKSDGYPTYNFAHIVDDIEMGVTHVMRGQEFISSTPKFLAVYEALGVTPPLFVTMPPILADGGQKKLGKRDGAKDFLDYRNEGYLPATLANFLALLGWNPGGEQEIFTMDELIALFTLERIQRSGAQMNLEKLDWMNKEHMRKLSTEERITGFEQYLPEAWKEKVGYRKDVLIRADAVVTDHVVKFSDIKEHVEKGEIDYLFMAPTVAADVLLWKNLRGTDAGKQITKENLEAILAGFTGIASDLPSAEEAKAALWPTAEARGKGETLWPTRVAMTGLEKSPDPFMVISILGKEEAMKRIETAIKALS